MNLSERTAIVTGSGGSIGRAIARALAGQGARVACASLAGDDLQETVRQIRHDGGVALAIPTDITRREQVAAMVAQVAAAFGPVDVLVNNAGACRAIGALWEVDTDDWDADIALNLLGHFYCCRAVLPQMIERNQGVIVNLAGGGFDRPNPGLSAYASAKAGLMRLTDTLAAELTAAGYAIQVYGLWPGFVRSGMTENLARTPQGQRWLPHVKRGLEQGEDHTADDVGRAVVRLIEMSQPALSGRIFAYDDDWEWIARHAADLYHRDLHQLRLRRD